MKYWLGIDLGTTSSAAAVVVDGRAEMVELAHTSNSAPSVVVRSPEGSLVVGDHAVSLAASRPTATAREFKRRFGDSTPHVLDGVPFTAAELTSVLFHHVVDAVVSQRGELPEAIVATHPTNWGEYKRTLLHNTIVPVWSSTLRLLPEPEAAAIHYASQERVADGSVVAVYDLGGGTFDAAVLRKLGSNSRGASRWEQLGASGGIEHLGGIDFDEIVLDMALERLDVDRSCLDEADPVTQAAVSQLRSSCRDAKELLSSSTSASIVSFLPGSSRTIRITRAEFEALIIPKIDETIAELADTIASAFADRSSVDRILLVGGSSRIPLVGQLVGHRLGRPVAVDAHPKHAIALGAAASIGGERASVPSTPPMPPVELRRVPPIPPRPVPRPPAPTTIDLR